MRREGLCPAYAPNGRHVVTSVAEHVSVLNSCRELEKRGWRVSYVAVDGERRVDPDAVARALTDETALVSVQAANHEISKFGEEIMAWVKLRGGQTADAEKIREPEIAVIKTTPRQEGVDEVRKVDSRFTIPRFR